MKHTIRHRIPFFSSLIALTAACAESPEPPVEPSSDPDDGVHLVTEEGAWGAARIRTTTGERIVHYQVRDGHAILEGDIDLGPVRRLFQRGGAASLGERWPNNTVYFAFDPQFGPSACAADAQGTSLDAPGASNCACTTGGTHCVHVRTRAREIIADLDARLPVRFVEVSPDDSRQKVLVRWGGTDPETTTAGRSEVGYSPDGLDTYQHLTLRYGHQAESPTTVGLGPYNLEPTFGTVRHEMLHTLGLFHEQGRSDRDQFIDIHAECIVDGGNNFDSHDESADVGPYDFRSLMHYSPRSFCVHDLLDKDGDDNIDECDPFCPTMTKDATGSSAGIGPVGGPVPWNPSQTSGAFADLTTEDVNTVFHMYAVNPDTNAADEHFGSALAVADFDGDGYDDVAVGVPTQDVAGVADAGYVIIYKGTATGLVFYSEISASTLAGYGAIAGAQLGTALAAGDVNGDGFADLAIGAPGQPADGQPGAGVVVLMLGGRGGLTAAQFLDQSDWTAGSNSTNERFGSALAMGDFAALGRQALAVGAPSDLNPRLTGGYTNSGAVYIFAFSADAVPVLYRPTRITGDVTDSNHSFGAALAVGEFDEDPQGQRDLVVGAPSHGTGGKVYLHSGRRPPEAPLAWSAMVTRRAVISSPWAGAQFGAALAMGNVWVGDVLRPDLAIGAPAYSSSTGVVRVLDVKTDGTTTLVLNSLSASPQAAARYGAALAIADVDRSTASDDLIIGEPGDTTHGGRVWIGRGGIAGLPLGSALYQRLAAPLADEDPTDAFGTALAVGHLDGWGNVPSTDDQTGARRRDLVVGAPGAAPDLATIPNPGAGEDPAGAGAAYLFLGTSSGPVVGSDHWHQEKSGRL